MTRVARMAIFGHLVALIGCATTGATFRSGVGDAMLDRAPWVAGQSAGPPSSDLGHVRITWQRGATREAIFEPAGGRGTPVAALVEDMNRALDSMGVTRSIARGGGAPGTPPDVQFGCERHPGDDCEANPDSALGRGRQEMRLAVGRPSSEWAAWLRTRSESAGVNAVLVLNLEVGHYLIRQRGLSGSKVVELGTGNEAQLPWLTSLEGPVSVVQLTGALVEPGGLALRIAAEGILVRRTRLAVSAIGGQELVTDADVAALQTLRRADLPGQPLAWKVALSNLVGSLTGTAGRGSM